MKTLYSIILFLGLTQAFGQGLTAFEDYRNNFVVFDHGVLKTLENQPVQKYDIGGKAIAYIDYIGFFKIYSNGKIHEIAFGPDMEFDATDNLVSFFINDNLWVFDNGEAKQLTIWAFNYSVSDHTIAYLDNNENSFCMYQNGKITKLEDVITEVNDLEYAVGENTIAYSYQDLFVVNYGGQRFDLSFNNEPLSYKAGKNIVAFLDERDQTFKTFYKGQIITLEDFHPNWYETGDDMIIYKDQLDNLKVFFKGEIYNLSNSDITSIDIQDNICSFIDEGQFKIFNNGKITILEYEEPPRIILENNTALYLDQNNSLKYFNGIESEILTSERIESFDISQNTITYKNMSSRNRVYYNGKIY